MPFEVKKVMKYSQPFEDVYKAAYLSIKDLGGKVIKHDLANKQLFGQMDKKFKGEIVGDRSQLEMNFSSDEDGKTVLSMYAYPLNVIGQKLMFGARKGVVETVLAGFFEEIDKKLQSKA